MIFSEDKDPLAVIQEQGWEQITDRRELAAMVDQVLRDNPAAVEQIQGGDSKPMGFFVGQIMKTTSGRAEPGLVKELLKDRFALRFVQVLSMGGAITGSSGSDGEVSPGELHGLIDRLAREEGLPNTFRFEEIEISRILSEEILPGRLGGLDRGPGRTLGRKTPPAS